MSFEGHSLTSAEISHLAEIHGVCWPRLALSLLGGFIGAGFAQTPRTGPEQRPWLWHRAGSLCLRFCCRARVSSLAAGMRMGWLPSLEPGLSDGPCLHCWGAASSAGFLNLIFKKVYLHFR